MSELVLTDSLGRDVVNLFIKPCELEEDDDTTYDEVL